MRKTSVPNRLSTIRHMCETMEQDLASMFEDEKDPMAREYMISAYNSLGDARGAVRIALRRNADKLQEMRT